jgi:hypothetical protein
MADQSPAFKDAFQVIARSSASEFPVNFVSDRATPVARQVSLDGAFPKELKPCATHAIFRRCPASDVPAEEAT